MPPTPEIQEFVIGTGIRVRLVNVGASITGIETPDASGSMDNVVLSLDRPEDYLGDHPYLGSTVGRYANRIAGGTFDLDGELVELPCNDGANHLHGGPNGFHRAVWTPEAVSGSGVVFSHVSPHQDEGFPGTLTVRAAYRVTGSRLEMTLEAVTDRPTVVNLCGHSYFNLEGPGSEHIGNHHLEIPADYFTPVRPDLIPTGQLSRVAGTPFDFRKPRGIGPRLNAEHRQLALAGGFDHNFVLNGPQPSGGLRFAARLTAPSTGRRLEIHTTEPGLQFYSGHALDGSIHTARGPLSQSRGLCLETQHFPDSPNQAHFPSTVLRPGSVYRSRTVYVFSAGTGVN